jgi:formylglycine-generating enzyme required for sulfatase activity
VLQCPTAMSGAKGNGAPVKAGGTPVSPEEGAESTREASSKPGPRLRGAVAAGVIAVTLVGGAGVFAALRAFVKRAPPSTAFTPPTPVDVPDDAMVRVPGGTFRLGSAGGAPDEKPITEVTVPTLEIDVTEVTVAAFGRCVSAGKCAAPDTGMYCNWGKDGHARHPVNCVDLKQATDYCAFSGKRLPTEEEWEYAATSGDGRAYPWTDATSQPPGAQLCWNGEGSDVGVGQREGTCPVASYPAGRAPSGAFDMAGNVWEWTSSAHCPYDQRGCSATKRIIRGGAWNNVLPRFVRAAHRGEEMAVSRPDNVGFRCVKNPS